MNPFLSIYRLAWILALPPVAALAGLDGRMRRLTGKGFLPGTWRVTERMSYFSPGPRRALWLHCASLGEAKGLWAFAFSLTEAPDLVLTATTADGAAWLEARCEDFREDALRGLSPERRITAGIAPFDHPGVLRRFLDAHGALGLCLYEVELWPNAIEACGERGLPVALVSARLTVRAQGLYRRFGGAGARLLDGLAWIQAQSGLDRERFASLTKTAVLVGCDFKAAHYLGASQGLGASQNHSPFLPPRAPDDSGMRHRFAFLSLHYRELLLLLPGLPGLMARTDLILFPRKMSEVARFRACLEPLGFEPHSRNPRARHVLVDAMGRISALLPDCHSAFVGGSLIPLGCHNLWEPLLAGCRVHFGPHYQCQESLAGRLREWGLGGVLEDPRHLGALALPDPDFPAASAERIRELRQGLDSALLEGGRRIFATFYPHAIAGRSGGDANLPAGKDKGQQR